MNTLLAVDGSSVFMRALSVLPEDKRTEEDLEYMTVSMIRKAVRHVGATHLLVALDTVDQCWRYKFHPTYKDGRDYPDLRPKQLTPLLLPRLRARGIATSYNPEMEADDILSTLAVRTKDSTQFIAYTRDSDLYGLATRDNTSILWPHKGGELELVDRAAVHQRLGHPPDWIPMVRALTADTKDNLRGMLTCERAKGWRCPIVTKRAVSMLDSYGGKLWEIIEAAVDMYEEPFDMKPNEQIYIAANADAIGGMWQVAILRPDADLNVDAAATSLKGVDLHTPRRDD